MWIKECLSSATHEVTIFFSFSFDSEESEFQTENFIQRRNRLSHKSIITKD